MYEVRIGNLVEAKLNKVRIGNLVEAKLYKVRIGNLVEAKLGGLSVNRSMKLMFSKSVGESFNEAEVL